ncbi:putative secreted protein (Por secretion system target) [Arcicella aurantiaca]|uniref:Putative secreted protein (Por secretion system target) n=1 Tax=Arcicella aurantiaca TaxID=591202 RepID=A0A316DJA8_9BACT|nr:T9SS type A sorting domain-containing protein [Arcicella aurantiaca]PWK16713.1 putative secreted protein (Por secretion system target) [Arcicella aurantiaca]
MNKVITILLSFCIFSTYAQQTISDWKYQKDMSSNPQNFVKAGKKIYFVATTPEYGRELWVTEGTSESTKLVKDIMVGENSGLVEPANFYNYTNYNFVNNVAPLEDGTLYFVASDNPNEKPKIWVTDGTEKGTKIYQNEVKGTLFHTGDELVEYETTLLGKMIIYRKANKVDTISVVGRASPILRSGSVLTLGMYGSESPERYFFMISVDMKDAKVKVKTPTLYFQDGFRNTTLWDGDMFATHNNKVFRMNTKTGILDTLFVGNKNSNLNVQSLYSTNQKLYLTVSNKVYYLQSDKFLPTGNTVLEDVLSLPSGTYEEYVVTSYDAKNDILYSFRNENNWKDLNVKGIRLSDNKLVKDFKIPSFSSISNYTAYSSFRNVSEFTKNKVFVSATNEPYGMKILDISNEKIVDFKFTAIEIYYGISNRNYVNIADTDNFLMSDPDPSKITDRELYLFDSQTDNVKLLKNINTTGISTPKVYTTTFNGKLVQVYSGEQGIMLGVSDGTKAGTKDLKLLVKNYSTSQLRAVVFQSINERLGILITTQNATSDSNDSTFLYVINLKNEDIKLLVKNKSTFSMGSGINGTFGGEIKQINPSLLSVKIYPFMLFTTDLTIENTKFINGNVGILTISDKELIFANATPFSPYFYNSDGEGSYLLKFNVTTQKIDTIPNSQKCVMVKQVNNKIYFVSRKNNKSYVTDGNTTTELVGIQTIADVFTVKNKTILLESLQSSGIDNTNFSYYTTQFNFWQIDGNTTKKVFSYNSTNRDDNLKIDTKIWEINGRVLLISNVTGLYRNVSSENKIRFYEIKNDLTFEEVYQMNRTDGYFGSPSLFEFDTFKAIDVLNKGILFKQIQNDNQIFYVMQDDFIQREVYRVNVRNRVNPYFGQEQQNKAYYFVSNGSLFISDGSQNGSQELINNSLEKDYYYDIYKIAHSSDKNIGEFYFSFINTEVHGINFFKTDGTKNGTIQLIKGSNISTHYTGKDEKLGIIGNKILFRKPNATTLQAEVWTTEGTISTTQKLKDSDGNILSQPLNFTYDGWQNLPKINNKLYFSRQTEKNGYEPWETDGTPEGTKMIGDLVKGIQSSNPYQFIEINQLPYCIATEENKSLQLWSFCNPKVSLNVDKSSPIYTEEVKLLATQNNDWKYQWLKDGKALDKANTTTFTATVSGTYQIKIEDKIGCTNVSDSIVINFTQKILANEELTDEFELNVFPNPAQNDLNVIFNKKSKGVFHVSLYDLSGNLLINQDVQSNTTNTISTQNLSSGTYFIRLTNGEKQTIRKIMKH